MQGRAPAIRVTGVTKSFADGESRVAVLHDIAFEIMPGELTFLVGPSGCGKTTLISVIAGILRPDDGDVDVFGTRLGTLGTLDLARFRAATIGFIFQQFNLLPALTALENASVPLLIGGMRTAAAEHRAAELLERLGLGDHLGKLPAQLSGGQQQRVAIARALVHGPRLVVCDEPTSALDGAAGQSVMQLLRELAVSPDRAALVVTHDDRIRAHADRTARMADGRIAGIESRPETGVA
jgi:putative ABC transport system ATP-binding protein